MGGKVEHLFQIEHWRRGVSGFEVLATAGSVSVARSAFWTAVDTKGGGLLAGDELLLCHGARVTLRYPPATLSERASSNRDPS